MSNIFPEASQELGNIGNLLSDIVTTTNQSTSMPVDIGKATRKQGKFSKKQSRSQKRSLKNNSPT